MYDNQSLVLPANPTVKDFQRYVDQLVKVRGWEHQPIPEVFMLLLEECGELAKAARKQTHMSIDQQSKIYDVEQEAADVFVYLLSLCNRFNIDLEKAFRAKEEINKQRTWG